MKSNNHNVNLTSVAILFKYKTNYIQTILLIHLLGLIAPAGAYGQNVDSLKSLLQHEFGCERPEILYELVYYYTDLDNRQAMSFVNEASRLNEIFARFKILIYGISL